MIRDILAVLSLASIAVGLTYRFGWPITCIIVGAVVLGLVLAGVFDK